MFLALVISLLVIRPGRPDHAATPEEAADEMEAIALYE
jgi:hypothetical protein